MRAGLAGVLAIAAVSSGCVDFLSRLSRDGGPTDASAAPPDLEARRFGRWTCGAEVPWGRSAPSFELLRRLGPGRAWELSVDEDGLAELRVVGQRGRARQGCWAALTGDERAALERSVRGADLCQRPDDPRGPAGESAYDVDVRFAGLACARHFTAASLVRTPAGRRFAEDVRWWLDQVSNGSFQKVESFAIGGRPPARGRGAGDGAGLAARAKVGAAGTAPRGRLRCGQERESIYEAGDSWLLDYSYQKGLLWRRDVEVSERGAVAIDFASFQNGARLSCVGRLGDEELAALRAALRRARPCELPTAEPRLGEDRGYVGARLGDGAAECRARPVRGQEMRGPFGDARRFDEAVTGLVSDLMGRGGVDPFDTREGVLAAGTGRGHAAAQSPLTPAGATTPASSPAPGASFLEGFARR